MGAANSTKLVCDDCKCFFEVEGSNSMVRNALRSAIATTKFVVMSEYIIYYGITIADQSIQNCIPMHTVVPKG